MFLNEVLVLNPSDVLNLLSSINAKSIDLLGLLREFFSQRFQSFEPDIEVKLLVLIQSENSLDCFYGLQMELRSFLKIYGRLLRIKLLMKRIYNEVEVQKSEFLKQIESLLNKSKNDNYQERRSSHLNSNIQHSMKFPDLKNLIQQGKLAQFQQQLDKESLVAADYNLLLRQLIKNKAKNIAKAFQKLTKKGADVNFANVGGEKKSNLMVACSQGNHEIVQLLLSHPKIDLGLEDSMKKTAAFYAIQNKNKADSEIFLDKILTMAPQLVNRAANNQTMLSLSIKKQKLQLVRILLNHGAQPNFQIPDSGNSALHEALKSCKSKQTRANKQIVKLLIEYGADPELKNKKDKNAFEFAEKFPLKELIAEVKPRVQEKLIKQNTNENVKPVEKQDKIVQSKQQSLVLKHQNSKKVLQNRQNPQNRRKLFQVATENQINERISKADEICRRQMRQIAPHKSVKKPDQFLSQDEQNADQDSQISYSQSESSQDDQTQAPFRRREQLTAELSEQISKFTARCDQIYQNTHREFEKFYNKLSNIAQNENYNVELCGSFSTGLWLKNCDIDILLIPKDQYIGEQQPNYVENILDRFQALLKKEQSIKIVTCIKNKKIRVPMLRLDIEFPYTNGKTRKVDITVFDRNHNGLAITHYILQNLRVFPQLKPLFFVIKSLTYHFKLCDPKNGGIRTYAIVIMILSFLQNERLKGVNLEQTQIGELLLRFLHFFGYEYQYGYGSAGELKQDNMNTMMMGKMQMQPVMILTIFDPLNHTNNLGKNTKAYELQTMFKAAFIALHANIKQQKLTFVFHLKKISIF